MGSIRTQGTDEELARIIAGGTIGKASIYQSQSTCLPCRGLLKMTVPLGKVPPQDRNVPVVISMSGPVSCQPACGIGWPY